MYLTLATGRGTSTEYRRDQLWVVGSAPELAAGQQTGVGDRLNRPWCMVVRSCWHGPNHEGRCAAQGCVLLSLPLLSCAFVSIGDASTLAWASLTLSRVIGWDEVRLSDSAACLHIVSWSNINAT